MSKIVDRQVKLKLNRDSYPVFIKARTVPFSLKLKIEDELGKLE